MIGSKLGGYEVLELLGKGGMGEVYSASDSKLGRSVAIKVLPQAFTHDPDRVSRFKREAKVLAALNHPNIATIYGLEESGEQQFLVMELVSGETLADKLNRGPVPLEEGLRIALQIAEALEAAHEKGIVHRDLKPANVKITADAKVKVLDFGLAKALENDTTAAALSNSPTLTGAGSYAGMILGTAAYMSPEQAKGFAADPRSDVFSFGCVLYEMLTGKQAFAGDTASDILASVLKTEPSLDLLPARLNPRLRELLKRTLAKNPKQRFHAVADVRFEIEQILSVAAGVVTDRPPTRHSPVPWIAAAAATLAFASVAVLHFRETAPLPPPEMRLEITTPSTLAPLEFALSPDGRYIVFVASGDGPQRLWLRPLDKTEAQPLVGTEGANNPFWSPDSRSIGFTAAGKLKRTDIAGGSPQILANTFASFGGAWSSDGWIVFSAGPGPLSRVSTSGGDPVVVTKLDTPRQVQHRFPRFLPDGRRFIYYSIGTPEGQGIYLASLDGGEPKRLTAADAAGAYVPPGMIAYVRGTTLMARHLDLEKGELSGDPVTIADPVGFIANGTGGFSVSPDGRIAYRGGIASLRQLRWYDRAKGADLALANDSDGNTMLYPELSPDGTRLAMQRSIQNNTDVWVLDLARHGLTRFTFDPAIDLAPVWSPDGQKISFASSRKGPYDLYVKASSGAGIEEPLLESPINKYPQDWSEDGRFLLYAVADPKTGRDLWVLPITGAEPKPFVAVQTPFEELNGQFSPDSRWIVYETNESGRFEIVVQPFPQPSGKWQVSTGGGVQPRWKADGKELYFIAPDGKLMAASVTTSGATFAARTPVALFTASPVIGLGANKHQYIVSRDGRFLVNQPAQTSVPTPITLILNWRPDRGQ